MVPNRNNKRFDRLPVTRISFLSRVSLVLTLIAIFFGVGNALAETVDISTKDESVQNTPFNKTEPKIAEVKTESNVSLSTSKHARNREAKDASAATIRNNEAVYARLDFSDETEREFATKGRIAAPENLEIHDKNGNLVWSQTAFCFIETDAPPTANPSLWRNTQLNHLYGLFQVTEGIYQVRGYDISNITFIKGDTGWIVFDPLTSVETAHAALELVNSQLGEKPVSAVVLSHPHIDHYGGIQGILSEEDAAKRNVPILAPEGFHEHAVSEYVYAGNAMGRRAFYQYGVLLEPGSKGKLSIGIGLTLPTGTSSYIMPNDVIKRTGEKRCIDGVEMVFQLTPGTEAPAEMNTWFPQRKALWMAENCTGTLHNLYTLRGAQVRDGNAWANYIMQAVTFFGNDVEVVFQSHNWPHWGNAIIREYMINTAAAYKFINDQTLLFLNRGDTADEIANKIKLPESLEKVWYTRQYYGTVAHDSKAVYQKYMGWYDANPVHLLRLAPSEWAQKLVEYLGDVNTVLQKAQEDFDAGNYQWVAEITNVLVFADPKNEQARLLCADALEQLGYQAESGTWRNAYLCGAAELRYGVISDKTKTPKGNPSLMKAMTPEMMFNQMGILLDSNAAQHLNLKINFRITDDVNYLVTVNSGVLLHQKGSQADNVDATVTLDREGLFLVMTKNKKQWEKCINIEGDPKILDKLTNSMTTLPFFFNIVEP